MTTNHCFGFSKFSGMKVRIWIAALIWVSNGMAPGVNGQPAPAASTAKLPSEVRGQLEKQTAAMRAIHLIFVEKKLPNPADQPNVVRTFTVALDGNLIHEQRRTVVIEDTGKKTTQD